MNATSFAFEDTDLSRLLSAAADSELDELQFGVIGFDGEGVVVRYNRLESDMAGLSPGRVLGKHLFQTVAPCMNNFMVATRFEGALEAGEALDTTVNYVLTLRMKPVKVKLRLIAEPGAEVRYLAILRSPGLA